MTVEVKFREKPSVAVLASESSLALMDFKMLVQVSFLGERMIAAWESALIRALVSVDSQVIEEVMPLSEHFTASRMSAAEKPYNSSSGSTSIFIDHILVSVWNMFVDSD
tara:strand:- start:18 stop:344 length:327 start_codon:yes stop_codon:yes gene_type:complete